MDPQAKAAFPIDSHKSPSRSQRTLEDEEEREKEDVFGPSNRPLDLTL
jgi:hypothetical protein